MQILGLLALVVAQWPFFASAALDSSAPNDCEGLAAKIVNNNAVFGIRLLDLSSASVPGMRAVYADDLSEFPSLYQAMLKLLGDDRLDSVALPPDGRLRPSVPEGKDPHIFVAKMEGHSGGFWINSDSLPAKKLALIEAKSDFYAAMVRSGQWQSPPQVVAKHMEYQTKLQKYLYLRRYIDDLEGQVDELAHKMAAAEKMQSRVQGIKQHADWVTNNPFENYAVIRAEFGEELDGLIDLHELRLVAKDTFPSFAWVEDFVDVFPSQFDTLDDYYALSGPAGRFSETDTHREIFSLLLTKIINRIHRGAFPQYSLQALAEENRWRKDLIRFYTSEILEERSSLLSSAVELTRMRALEYDRLRPSMRIWDPRPEDLSSFKEVVRELEWEVQDMENAVRQLQKKK